MAAEHNTGFQSQTNWWSLSGQSILIRFVSSNPLGWALAELNTTTTNTKPPLPLSCNSNKSNIRVNCQVLLSSSSVPDGHFCGHWRSRPREPISDRDSTSPFKPSYTCICIWVPGLGGLTLALRRVNGKNSLWRFMVLYNNSLRSNPTDPKQNLKKRLLIPPKGFGIWPTSHYPIPCRPVFSHIYI